MVSITLNPAEFAEVELPCDATIKSLTLRVKTLTPRPNGTVIADVQTSNDGLTWSSPVAQARLKTEERVLPLNLKEGVRKLRVLLHNTSEKPVSVQIGDPMLPEANEATPEGR